MQELLTMLAAQVLVAALEIAIIRLIQRWRERARASLAVAA